MRQASSSPGRFRDGPWPFLWLWRACELDRRRYRSSPRWAAHRALGRDSGRGQGGTVKERIAHVRRQVSATNQTPDQRPADMIADTVAFPVLSAAELAECAEFGTHCSFAAGEEIFGAGSQPFDCYVIVSGDVL